MQKKTSRSDYKTCPFCGASLDIGERCECEKEEETRPEAHRIDFKVLSGYKCTYSAKMENTGY